MQLLNRLIELALYKKKANSVSSVSDWSEVFRLLQNWKYGRIALKHLSQVFNISVVSFVVNILNKMDC